MPDYKSFKSFWVLQMPIISSTEADREEIEIIKYLLDRTSWG